MQKTVIIGGSAGSFIIISRIISSMKEEFDFPLVICVHRSRTAKDAFIQALKSRTTIQISEAKNNEILLPGRVYVAPAGYHMTFKDVNTVELDQNPPVNYSRPSIDVCLVSAANAFKENIICILLTGANYDGSIGMRTVHDKGGTTIIQDPKDAEIPTMPQSAVDAFTPKYLLSANKIISFIQNLIDHND